MTAFDPAEWRGRPGAGAGHAIDCHPLGILKEFAGRNGEPALARLGEAAREASPVVDFPLDSGHLALHD